MLSVSLQQSIFESAQAAWGASPASDSACLLAACLPFEGMQF
jgi:hypothetical protein